VIWASVKLGSIIISVGRREMLVSFHFPGKNIFQLRRLCQNELAGVGEGETILLYKSQIQLFEPHQPATNLFLVGKIYFLLKEIGGNSTHRLSGFNTIGERSNG
jgi:hypothetical protein